MNGIHYSCSPMENFTYLCLYAILELEFYLISAGIYATEVT